MDSSVSPKDEIWFLRVCHQVSNAVYHRGSECSIIFIFYSDFKRGNTKTIDEVWYQRAVELQEGNGTWVYSVPFSDGQGGSLSLVLPLWQFWGKETLDTSQLVNAAHDFMARNTVLLCQQLMHSVSDYDLQCYQSTCCIGFELHREKLWLGTCLIYSKQA